MSRGSKWKDTALRETQYLDRTLRRQSTYQRGYTPRSPKCLKERGWQRWNKVKRLIMCRRHPEWQGLWSNSTYGTNFHTAGGVTIYTPFTTFTTAAILFLKGTVSRARGRPLSYPYESVTYAAPRRTRNNIIIPIISPSRTTGYQLVWLPPGA